MQIKKLLKFLKELTKILKHLVVVLRLIKQLLNIIKESLSWLYHFRRCFTNENQWETNKEKLFRPKRRGN